MFNQAPYHKISIKKKKKYIYIVYLFLKHIKNIYKEDLNVHMYDAEIY